MHAHWRCAIYRNVQYRTNMCACLLGLLWQCLGYMPWLVHLLAIESHCCQVMDVGLLGDKVTIEQWLLGGKVKIEQWSLFAICFCLVVWLFQLVSVLLQAYVVAFPALACLSLLDFADICSSKEIHWLVKYVFKFLFCTIS